MFKVHYQKYMFCRYTTLFKEKGVEAMVDPPNLSTRNYFLCVGTVNIHLHSNHKNACIECQEYWEFKIFKFSFGRYEIAKLLYSLISGKEYLVPN